MSKGFFGKLNHLVKAHINDLVSPIDERTSRSRRKALARQDIRGGLQGDVKTLRQRVDDALAYEGELQAKVDKLYQEVGDWDQKADKAVADGRDADARTAITRMQQAKRELEMMEADLQEHRYVTQELISQVNMLESVVAESEESPQPPATDAPGSTEQGDNIGDQIVRQLDNTRQKLGDLISTYSARVSEEISGPKKHYIVGGDAEDEESSRPAHPIDRRKVDDDLQARLSRLSKPEKDDGK